MGVIGTSNNNPPNINNLEKRVQTFEKKSNLTPNDISKLNNLRQDLIKAGSSTDILNLKSRVDDILKDFRN